MRAQGERVTIPVCALKPQYRSAFLILWDGMHIPVDEVSDQDWEAELPLAVNEEE